MKFLAMATTLGGIVWVVSEPRTDGLREPRASLRLGALLAVGGALANAFGLLCSLYGLEGGFHPLSATTVRVLGGACVSGLWLLLRREFFSGLLGFRDTKAAFLVVVATLSGTIGGVTLSLVAIAHAPLGVAATIMGLSPVFLLPLSALVFKEKISARAILGTLLSLLGVAGLFSF